MLGQVKGCLYTTPGDRRRCFPILEIYISSSSKETTIPVNLQTTLIKFRIKSGSQCQWLTFLAREVVVKFPRSFLPARLARWRRAHRAGRPPLSHSTGVTTQWHSRVAQGPASAPQPYMIAKP